MMCQEVRELIDRDGAPTTGDANAHIHDCPACSEFWAHWQEVQQGLHALGEEEAPPFLHTRLMAHVREAADADARKKEAWFLGLKKIWAGPLLVLFLGMLMGGYGLIQVWRPKTMAPPVQMKETAEPANVLKDKLASKEADFKQQAPSKPTSQAPSPPRSAPNEITAPEPPSAESGQDILKETSSADSSKAERNRDDSLFASPEVAEGKKGDASSYQPLANRAEGEPRLQGEASGGLQETRRSNAPAAPPSPRIELGAAAPATSSIADEQGPSEVVCTLSPLSGSGPFITLQLPAGAAPPSGGVWTIHVPQEGPLRVLDALGKPIQAPMATVSAVIRPLHVPPGSYKLKRIS